VRNPLALLLAAALAGCGATIPERDNPAPLAIVASPLEPAAQFGGSNANYADGALIGAAGGAGIGAVSAQASAGLLCTIGGPLCLVVVVPAAIVGGLVGGVAGAAVDALTSDPGGRIAEARGTIEQTLADLRFTDGLAAKTSAQLNLPVSKAGDLPLQTVLEVGVSDLELVAKEKEMALVLHGRSRLYRTPGGELLEERVAQARTEFRKYQDWAADDAQPLRRAVDEALGRLSRSLVSARPGTLPRADISARQGG
jgi:hypothetical protein